MIGVKIYGWDNAPTDDEAVARMIDMGVNAAFIDHDVAKDVTVRKRLKAAGIRVHVIFPVFFDGTALRQNPDEYAVTNRNEKAKVNWLSMVCPTRKRYLSQKVMQAQKYAADPLVDGVSLDFLRYFTFWEQVYPGTHPDTLPQSCFCSSCILRFQEETGTRVPVVGDVRDTADWIIKNAEQSWTRWKCEVINGAAERLAAEVRSVSSRVHVNLHAVPWRPLDYRGAVRRVMGQDVRALGPLVDTIQPMVYAPMLRRELSWIHDVVASIAEVSGARTVSSIQVAGDGLSLEGFRESIRYALLPPSAGVVFYSWKMLADDPVRFQMAKEAVLR